MFLSLWVFKHNGGNFKNFKILKASIECLPLSGAAFIWSACYNVRIGLQIS